MRISRIKTPQYLSDYDTLQLYPGSGYNSFAEYREEKGALYRIGYPTMPYKKK